MLLAITAAGRMLMFPVSDCRSCRKEGNKIINIPSAEAASGQDGLAHLFVLPPQSTLTIHVGKRKIKLRPEELQKVTGERGSRLADARTAENRPCGNRFAASASSAGDSEE
jgi:topoisomerase-4 subunit A